MKKYSDSIPTIDQQNINDFYAAIKKSLNWIKQRNNSKLWAEIKRGNDLIPYKKEFCSIVLNLSRRAGNTTLALKLFRAIDDSFLAFPNLHQSNDSRVRSLDQKRILTPRSIDRIRGMKGSVMIVDTASCISEAQMSKLYSSAVDYFILLG